MKPFVLFLFLFIPALIVKAQHTYTLKGAVYEGATSPIPGAGILLVAGKDTIKTVADSVGKFSFKKLKSSKFTLTVRFLGYAPYTKVYEVAESDVVQLDPVILKEEATTLSDVVIKGKIIPVTIKEDTIEYNASAYKTREKDRASELIKQLPGIEIDKDGNVKSMGKALTKIRVNGKDFFTGDVKEFMKKLPADIIAKVQVIDDYGDEANFTGIKTGTPSKILNLVMKDNKNSGLFGGAKADVGTNKQYVLDGGANLWKDEKQASLNTRLNTQDNGVGKSKGSNIGFNYNTRFNKQLRGGFGYNYNSASNDSQNISTQETVTDSLTINNQNNSQTSGNNKDHRLNGQLFKMSGKDILMANVTAAFSNSSNSGMSQSLQTIKNTLRDVNSTRQDLNTERSNKGKAPNVNATLNYTRKMNKKGRSLSLNMTASQNESIDKENVSDQILYYDKATGQITKDSLLNRLLDKNNKNRNLKAGLKYAEPLNSRSDSTGKKNIDFGYDFSVNNTDNRLQTFVGDHGNVHLVDSLSNAYTSSFLVHSFNLFYRFHSKSWRYAIGVAPRLSVLSGKYENLVEGLSRSTFSLSPTANFTYDISKRHFFDFNLSQATTPPSFSQLQPVPDTRNLQNITIGNPDLKPSVSQNAVLNYRSISPKNGTMLQVGINGSLVQNKVVTNTVLLTDTLNSIKQETRYENANGDYTVNGQYSFSKPILNNKYSLELTGSVGLSNNIFYSDNVKGLNKSLNLSQGLTMRMNQKWITLNANASYSLSSNTYTVGSGNVGDVQNWVFNTDARIILAPSLNTGFEVFKTINTGYALTNSNPLLINLNLEKFIFNKRASIKLSGFDLLAQGNNQQRTVSGNTTTDTRSNQVTRYFLMSFNVMLEQFGIGRSSS